ncbi:MAG: hypothetical protein HXS53_11245 [Theionarchaea archaeon]|nr:hypothetical protein [Theionarchaea archaeon]
MLRRIPLFGLLICAFILLGAYYLSTLIDSTIIQFVILFIAFFFVASAFMGLFYEKRIGKEIIQAGYVDQYVANHGVGNRETFKAFIQELRDNGYKINDSVERTLWEEIKKKTGYPGYQTSV